jgi:molecular chaperone DnaJ
VTHYDVLGVPRNAPAATIRAAYRERARRHHPDRAGHAGGGEMAALNEAYRVLSDPARRSIYDRSLLERQAADAAAAGRARTAHDGAGQPDDDVVDGLARAVRPNLAATGGEARIPWKTMGIVGVIGSALIIVAAAFTDPPADEAPDGILRSGSCVAIEPNGDAREVACTGIDDIVVDVLVPTGATCPAGTEAHRDRLGLGTACVIR